MDQHIILFSAWRVMRLGSREITDALVRPAHQGPSPELRELLDQWPGAHYWADRTRTHLVLIRATESARPIRWTLHVGLFALTIICSLAAGAALSGSWTPPPTYPGLFGPFRSAGEFVLRLGQGDWRLILTGWSFALPLLAILLVHELGHYWAARRYHIDTSPPYFLPVPPTISPIGSFGAFLRLRSPVVDRQQLTDVGAAGPIAGFVVALAVLIWGYLVSERLPIDPELGRSYITLAGTEIFLGESLVTRGLRAWLAPGTDALHLSLPAFAGWVGCFITGLNLLPLSQLDGGHVLYGLLEKRQSWIALITVLGLLYLGQFSWNWYLWVAMALVVGGGRLAHPAVVVPGRSLPPTRRWVAFACIAIFIVTFVPIPFQV